jgi:diguanylate cyclase (GGDEF)-like protein/PAS domain S-box-containing protein
MKGDIDGVGRYAEECIRTNPDGVFCIDHQGIILFANKSFARMVGSSEEELEGMGVFRLFPSINPFDVSFAKRVGAGEVVRAEVAIARFDGGEVPVAVTISSVMAHGGAHHVAFCFVRDLGECERIAHVLEEEVAKREEAQRQLEETNEKLRALLMEDELTGAASRRFFIEEAERMLALAARSGEKVSLAILDVDLFKQINDRSGHLAGDRTLQKVVKAVKSSMRCSDLIARWGGDEFVVLLPDTRIDRALLLAARVRETVEEADFEVELPVTLSIGVAQSKEGDSVDSLIARADEALYKAKRAGRNRFESAVSDDDGLDIA